MNVVAMDMRGFGDSTWSAARDYSVPANARDILAIADDLGWQKFFLFGHSMSGRHCAVRRGESARIAGLVLGTSPGERARRLAARGADGGEYTGRVRIGRRCNALFQGGPGVAHARRDAHASSLKPVDGGFTVKRDPFLRPVPQGHRNRRAAQAGRRSVGCSQAPAGPDQGDPRRSLGPVRRGDRRESESGQPRITLVEIDAGHNIALDNPDAVVRETRSWKACEV